MTYSTTNVRFLENMPYGGKRYKSGATAEIQTRFVRPLVGLKKVEVVDGAVDEKPAKKSGKSKGYKTKDMKAE